VACATVPETRPEEAEKTSLKSLPYIMSHTAKLGELAILLAVEQLTFTSSLLIFKSV